MTKENNWPPAGFNPDLPADHQGMFDPGNDDPCECTFLTICAYHEQNGIDLDDDEVISED